MLIHGGSKPRQGVKTVSVPQWSVLPLTLTTLSALAGNLNIKVGRYLDDLTAQVRAAAAAAETFDNVDAAALLAEGMPTSLDDFKREVLLLKESWRPEMRQYQS
jgi:hypothetical protein